MVSPTTLNVLSEEGAIFRSGKVHHPNYNAQSTFDASSSTFRSARPTQECKPLGHRCFASFVRAVIKRCTNFGGAVESVLRTDTELLERCRALTQRPIAVMNFGSALVLRCRSGTRI